MLRNLIHFIGDAHQPLHVTNRYTEKYPNGDEFGEKFDIKGEDDDTLHKFWNHGLGHVDSYDRPLSKSSINNIIERANKYMVDYPRMMFQNELKLTNGFDIVKYAH